MQIALYDVVCRGLEGASNCCDQGIEYQHVPSDSKPDPMNVTCSCREHELLSGSIPLESPTCTAAVTVLNMENAA